MKRRVLFQRTESVNAHPALPLIEIAGDQRVLIERHKGVLGYDKQRVCVKLSFGVLLVCGCNLQIIDMSKNQLVIVGKILEITFKRGNN